MKRATLFTLIFLSFLSCREESEPSVVATQPPIEVDLASSNYFVIDVTDPKGFKIELQSSNLPADNSFHLPATVPGVYSMLNMGRFAKGLTAVDQANNSVAISNLTVNEWKFNTSNGLKLRYEMLETYSNPLGNQVFLPAGSILDAHHALINPSTIAGYFTNLTARKQYIKFKKPDGWEIATTLPSVGDNTFLAANYAELIDSPFLMGNLSTEKFRIEEAEISIHVFSQNNIYQASMLKQDVVKSLLDIRAFLGQLPTNNYQFFFHFGPSSGGGLEHMNSSVYVLQEVPYDEMTSNYVRTIVAHEVFHLVTPLNIRSDVLSQFDFSKKNPSEHLWFYESITVWASYLMQFRNKSISLSELLNQLSRRLRLGAIYETGKSLTEISRNSYQPDGGYSMMNVFYRGAITALLMDIRLLELSDGKRGLREVMLELRAKYSSTNPFNESMFFQDFVSYSHPEMMNFIELYIQGNSPLPIAEYFAKIGIEYDQSLLALTPGTSLSPAQQKLQAKWSSN